MADSTAVDDQAFLDQMGKAQEMIHKPFDALREKAGPDSFGKSR
jgi:hypothetical protein